MKIKIISVDQDKSRQFSDMIAEYSKRLSSKLELVDLHPNQNLNTELQKEKEGQDIIKQLTPGSFVVAMDPHGKQLSSEEFAATINAWQLNSKQISFVIGGAYGLSNEVKQRADTLLSLSKMTMPHRIAKLVLVEQIYRAQTISQGHPYHK